MPTTATIRLLTDVPPPRTISRADVARLSYYLFEQRDVDVHHEQTKPFALWPLLLTEHQPADGRLAAEMRVHWLRDTGGGGRSGVARARRRADITPHLGSDIPVQILDVIEERISFGQLAAGPPASAANVDVLSPAAYSRNGRFYPLPDPPLVHLRLVQRWNEMAPPALRVSDELRQALGDSVIVTSADITTVPIGPWSRGPGFVGKLRFELQHRTQHDVRHVFATMWRWAALCGLGTGTAQGNGAVDVDLGDAAHRRRVRGT